MIVACNCSAVHCYSLYSTNQYHMLICSHTLYWPSPHPEWVCSCLSTHSQILSTHRLCNNMQAWCISATANLAHQPDPAPLPVTCGLHGVNPCARSVGMVWCISDWECIHPTLDAKTNTRRHRCFHPLHSMFPNLPLLASSQLQQLPIHKKINVQFRKSVVYNVLNSKYKNKYSR